ncbi:MULTISPECIES: copper resistance CopC family protein [unclassified Lentilitoribacter]|uniref:copper resistance CopC family protein n=1 Tax=unclassified Lentilitoribacter TaxID=2647570 RepID=UPI0013A6B159|nr:copper resistance protein CopC [Lentilitoribacter sp. Alg239-R112]
MKNIIATLILMGAFINSAFAHSKVDTFSPADGDVLTEVPEVITMNFAKPARITKVSVSHTEGSEDHDIRLDIPTKEFVKIIEFSPKLFGAGTYQVEWRALAEDGHALKGEFSFSVKSE